MTSKSSFFDLMKNKMKRNLWELLSFSLVFALYFPVASFMCIGQRMLRSEFFTSTELAAARRYIYNDFVQQISGMSIVAVLTLMAVVCAFTGFSYLHFRRQTDFYHSLPIRRFRLLAVNTLVNIIFVAVPYLVMSIISALIMGGASGYTGLVIMALRYFFIEMGFFLLIFMVAVLAMMLTGNTKVGLLGMVILFAWGPYIVYLWEGLYSQYFDTYYRLWADTAAIAKYTSPVAWALITDGSNIMIRAIIAYILAALFYLLNLRLYDLRKSEKAGSSMTFKVTMEPIKFIVAVPASLGIMAIFGGIMNNSVSWGGAAAVLGALLISGIMEMIYALDFKQFFAHLPTTISCIVIALIGFAFFNFDLSGYDLYIPDISDVDSIGIYTSALEDIYGREDLFRLDDTTGEPDLIYGYPEEQDVADRMEIVENAPFANELLANISKIRAEYGDEIDSAGRRDSTSIWGLLAAWKLKNGQTVYRRYTIDMSMVSDELVELYDDPEYKEGTYPILTKTEEEIDDLRAVAFQDIFGLHEIPFDAKDEDEEKAAIIKLYDTYKKELSSLKALDRRTHSPVTALQFRDSYFDGIYETVKAKFTKGDYNALDYVGLYPVYSTFTETLKLMKEYGCDINFGLDADDVERIVVSDIGYYGTTIGSDDLSYDAGPEVADSVVAESEDDASTQKPDLVVTDKDEIEEILNASLYNLSCSNSLRARWETADVSVNLIASFRQDNYDAASESIPATLYLYFAADDIPDFIREYFGITDDDISGVTNYIGQSAI